MRKALIIEWNPLTGKRAGGIDPKDPGLPCYGWQDMERDPAIEIRLITDDRDISQYQGKKGITILEGDKAITHAIKNFIPTQYSICDSYVIVEHMKEKKIELKLLGDMNQEILAFLYNQGISGIRKTEPTKLPPQRR